MYTAFLQPFYTKNINLILAYIVNYVAEPTSGNWRAVQIYLNYTTCTN